MTGFDLGRDASAVDRIRNRLDAGAPWEAVDVCREALERQPDHAELLYWGALASARAGATNQARTTLDRIEAMPHVAQDIRREGLCLAGRLWKDRVATTSDKRFNDSTIVESITRARDEYLKAFAIDRDAYPGVNAATLSLLAGERETANTLACEVIELLRSRGETLTTWQLASRGEAQLLLGDVDAARESYGAAIARAPGDAGGIASMRRQLRLVARVLPDARDLLATLPTSAVLAFAGRMVDRPGARPRFPSSIEPLVRAAIDARLARLVSDDGASKPIVYASAACGSDLLFIEAALAVGAEVNVVLPFARDDFVRVSVAPGGSRWVERFDRALAAATRVLLATDESHLGDDVLFEHAQLLIEGIAALRASQLETEARLLVVLDRESPAEVGGTRAAYDRWRATHGEPDVIDLAVLRHDAIASTPAATSRSSVDDEPSHPPIDRPQRTLKTLLFADIAGYGRLADALAPLFHARFLSLVSEQIATCATPPLESNTWGDALYVVFDAPADGAEFALGILERMRAVDWTAAGLSETSRIRIALHAGPVFCGYDPIAGRDNYFGASVTQAARIEPVVQPGLAYASEAFVATLAARGTTRFAFEYVGQLELAKRYGTSRLYRLERR